jgi:hypothetical protein
MNYKEAFAIDEIFFKDLTDIDKVEKSKYQLNNFNFYEPKLVDGFYLKYFIYNLLFEIDILELKEFLIYHYDYCDKPEIYYEILDYKVIPKIYDFIDNTESHFGNGSGYYQEKKLDYGFVESEGVIRNWNYDYPSMLHRTAMLKLQNTFKKRIQVISDFILDYKDKYQTKPLKWIAGPSHLAIIIRELIDKGYMSADKTRGEINNAQLARELYKIFAIDNCESSKSIEIYLSPQNKRNKSAKNNFENLGFFIPDAKFT